MAKSAKRARKAKRAPKPANKTARPRAAKPRKKPRPANTITAASVEASGAAADGVAGFFAIILDSHPKKPDLRLTKEGPDLATVRAFTEHDGTLRLVPEKEFRHDRIETKKLTFTPDGTTDVGAIFQLTPREG